MGSLGQPPQPAVDVTLSLFAGLKTDIAPADIPEGLSADNQDMIYLPGDAQSRPGLGKILTNGLLTTPNASVVYSKTYIQPDNTALTLFLTSDGRLWVENTATSPGAAFSPFQVPKTLYAQSVSAFGREYIAFSDLLHGQGVPLQYDGTFLDRVTQDGPGAGPSVTNFTPPPAEIEGATPAPVDIVASPAGIIGGEITLIDKITYYSSIFIQTTTPHGFAIGDLVVIAGSTSTPALNGTRTVTDINSATSFAIAYTIRVSSFTHGGGGTVADLTDSGASLSRTNSQVTAVTHAAHNFQVGWQVQISGINPVDLGGGITAISRDTNGVVTVTTSTAHGLVPQSIVNIAGVTNPDATFNVLNIAVASVPSPTTFTYQQGGTAESSTGASGNVQDVWNSTVFIQTIPNPTTFTYIQIGPDDSTNDTGLATILGQISPGLHNFVVMFLTRAGALTQPSPIVPFSANGNSQAAFSNIPTGPANVVARLIGATGAGGDNYFTLPVTPQVGGQIVGSSFLVPDNTSTAAIIDFSDNTLFAGIAIDQIGNDLFDQRVLGPVLGFYAYASRLACWGDYQKVENLLNMGFCGGPVGDTPLGWTVEFGGGTVVGGAGTATWPSGQSWRITGDGTVDGLGLISQPCYQDEDGTAILLPNTQYILRLWLKSAPQLVGNILVDFLDPATSTQLAVASIPCSSIVSTGSFLQATFSAPTPAVIPTGTKLRLYGVGMALSTLTLIGDVELVYAQNPYNNTLVHFSYALNPEGFAQTTGNLGAADDDSPVQCLALLRTSTLLETSDGVHSFQDNDSEPYQWNVNSLTRAVGAVSLRGGDPGKFGTGDAAEDWAVIASKNGIYLFAGAEFWKISQEISRGALPFSQDPRPTWDDINWSCQQTIVAKNDPALRRAYFCVPIGSAVTPNIVFMLDYREMDTATQIAGAPPMHITIQGKMKSSDLTRKWSVWRVTANDCEILVRPGNQRQLCFAGGNGGLALGTGTAYGNVYDLDSSKLTDDDYGQISPYYTTYAFIDHDQEQALRLGSGRHIYKKISMYVAGVGFLTITPIISSLYNFQPALSPRLLTLDTNISNFLDSDLEWTTQIHGERVFFRISVQPLPGTTDVQMRIQKMIVSMMTDPIAVARGAIL